MLDSKSAIIDSSLKITESSHILACDVGLKRIGLAQCTQGIVLPLPAIVRKNRNQASRELSALLVKKQIEVLVVGLPSGGQAQHQDMIVRIKHFVGLVAFDGQIVYVDEDYTSQEALEDLAHLGREARALAQKDGRLDSLSACYILERYLQSMECVLSSPNP